MTISNTCRKILITKGVLSAECQKADKKTYITSSISLDGFIGCTDGKFTWGGKNFSQYAKDVSVVDGILIGKCKVGEKYVDSKIDLNPYIINNDGVLTATIAGNIDVAKPKAPVLEKTLSSATTASVASAASMFSATSASSATSYTSANTYNKSSSYSKSGSYFRSSSFRSQSEEYLIQDTCSNFQIKGTHLHCDFNHYDGRVSHTCIDLDLYIGCANGRLEWDGKGFSKECTDIVLDGFYLTAKCRVPAYDGHKEHYVPCRFDLCARFRIKGCVLICIETDKKLSIMLSEVPWMKFKVIAEPDLSVFGSHPVVKHTMTRIAESTVEHVTIEMHKMLTIAMEEAIVAITASAMKYISIQMEQTVLDVVGCAAASPSVTEAECLHVTEAWKRYGGGGYAGGTYANGKGGYAGAGGYAGGTYTGGGGYKTSPGGYEGNGEYKSPGGYEGGGGYKGGPGGYEGSGYKDASGGGYKGGSGGYEGGAGYKGGAGGYEGGVEGYAGGVTGTTYKAESGATYSAESGKTYSAESGKTYSAEGGAVYSAEGAASKAVVSGA